MRTDEEQNQPLLTLPIVVYTSSSKLALNVVSSTLEIGCLPGLDFYVKEEPFRPLGLDQRQVVGPKQ